MYPYIFSVRYLKIKDLDTFDKINSNIYFQIFKSLLWYIFECIRCTTLLPPFFPKIWGFILKKWLPIYNSKYCPSLATTFFHLSGNRRIPSRKNVASFEAIHELIHFLTSFIRAEMLMRQAVCHRSKQMLVGRSNISRSTANGVRQRGKPIYKFFFFNHDCFVCFFFNYINAKNNRKTKIFFLMRQKNTFFWNSNFLLVHFAVLSLRNKMAFGFLISDN